MKRNDEDEISLTKLCEIKPSSGIAVLFHDGKSKTSLSSTEFLSEQVTFIDQLKSVIGENDMFIGIYAESSLFLPVVIHSLIELCWTFVPLPLQTSSSSLLYYIKFCRLRFVIVDSNSLSTFLSHMEKSMTVKISPIGNFHIVKLTFSDASIVQAKRDNITYVVQSSGSTGKPKAIFVTEPCITPNVKDLRQIFGVRPGDVIFISSALTFDASILLMFVAWSSGATMALVSKHVYSKPHLLELAFKSLDVGILQCTPSFLHFVGFERLKKSLFRRGSNLRVLALGGERFVSKSIVKKIFTILPELELFNIYGTSELSSWASIYKVREEDLIKETNVQDSDWVPIGEPLSQTIIKVRDESGGVISSGVGQVWIGSYERICFVDCEEYAVTSRFTGDVGKFEDNMIHLCGRSDNRLKHNGQMVNLDLLCMVVEKDFGSCFCTVDISNGKDHFNLYIRSSLSSRNPIEVEADVIKLIKKLLPPAYIPKNIVFVEHLPITSHGKVDRNALKDISFESYPYSTLLINHRFLETLWKASLGLDMNEEISNEDNFIECGGDSFTAVYFLNNVQKYIDSSSSHQNTSIEELFEILMKGTFKRIFEFWNKILRGEHCKRDVEELVSFNGFETKQTEENCHHFLSYQKQARIVKCCCADTKFLPSVISKNEIPQTLTISWKFNVGKCIDASPLVVYNETFPNGVVFIGSHSKLIGCLDLLNGHLIWKACLGDRIESSAIVCPRGDVIAVGCYDGYVYFLKIHCGSIVWKYFTGDSVKSTAVADMNHDVIIVGSHGKKIHALDVQTKSCVWIFGCQSSCFSTPIINKEAKCVYVALLCGDVLCICVERGQLLWKVSLGKPIFSSLCLARNILIVGCVDHYVYALDSLGKITWKFETQGPVFASPVFSQEKILFGSNDCSVYCLSIDGQLLWKYRTSSKIVSAVSVISTALTNVSASSSLGSHEDLPKPDEKENSNVDNPRKRKYETVNETQCKRVTGTTSLHFIVVSTKGEIDILSDAGVRMSHLQLSGEVYSSPIVTGNQILVGCRDDHIYSLRFS